MATREKPSANVTIVQPTLISSCFDLSPVRYSSGGDGLVRYKTAGILSAVLVVVTAAMFALRAAVWAVFLPSLKQGLPDPIPGYEKILLEVAVFCAPLEMDACGLHYSDHSGAVHHCGIHECGAGTQRDNRNASTGESATCALESGRGGGLESPFFASIRSIPACSQRRRNGARGRGESQQSVVLLHHRLFWIQFAAVSTMNVPTKTQKAMSNGLFQGFRS